MTKIQYKTKSIYITSKGVNVDNNNCTANIFCDVTALTDAIELFDDGFALVDGLFTKSCNIAIGNLKEIGDNLIIEDSDLGKSFNEAMSTTTINIIFNNNLLNLELKNWEII